MRGTDWPCSTVIVERTALFRTTSIAAPAALSETPGLRRPITNTHHSFAFVRSDLASLGAAIGSMLKGRKISGDTCTLDAPVNSRGLTPIMVAGVRFTLIVLPITSGERPKCRDQNALLITATAPLP